MTVRTPIPPTMPKAALQLMIWPRNVAIGVPIRVAMVSPSITRPTARARLCSGTMDAATSAATPK